MTTAPQLCQDADPVEEFRQAIANAGLHPPASIVADGRLHRFASNGQRRDTAGWYVLHLDSVPAGKFGCWRLGNSMTWSARSERELSSADRAEFRRRMEEIRRVRQEAEEELRRQCRERAGTIWDGAQDANPEHPYLATKQVQPYGIRQQCNRLVIPVRDCDGELHGLQFIGEDGGKIFLLGTAKASHFHLIGDPSTVVVVAEGFATAVSVHKATGHAVAVAFDAGNLKSVAQALRTKFPEARVLVAGDHDASGVGQEKARAAASVVSGVAIIPEEAGDWNDVAAAAGLEAVRSAFITAQDNVPAVTAPAGFIMRETGLWWEDTSDPDKPPLHLSGPFETVAETRDVDGSAWGILLRWSDHDGRAHEWAMPRAMLASDGAEARRMLLDGGLYVAPGRKARDLLNSFLGSVKVSMRARAVGRIGWHDGSYVLPDGTIGPSNGERVLLQTGGTVEHAFRVSGDLTTWQDKVAAQAIGNSRLVLAVATGFAAPLLEIIGAESGGFHFRGASSTGKSTALLMAGSVWGGGDVSGFVRSWRLTSNGLEGVAGGHCDSLLCLDELGQVAAKEAGEVAYMLANGAGKARASRDGSARKAARWRVLFLSSGEISLADKVAEDGRGRRAAAGQQVRVVDIPADAGAGCGLFESLHGFADGDALARHLKAAAGAHYGLAGRTFVEAVANDTERVRERVKGFVGDFVTEHCPAGADGQVARVAQRFALVAAAGELASQLGILPWPAGEAITGAARCFRDWLDGRGGVEPAETRDGIAQIRRFLEAHGESRFTAWGGAPEDNHRPTINRAGFRRTNADGGTEYYVLPQAWKAELCAGFDPRTLADVLVDRELLIPDADGKPQSRHRLPGLGVTRCYRLSGAILGGDDA
jgi:putative DNA primase/helicase